MSYDARCYELATAFLVDVEGDLKDFNKACEALAEHIQNAIEEWIEYDSHAFRKSHKAAARR